MDIEVSLTRRRFLGMTGASAAVLGLGRVLDAQGNGKRPPNVIVMMADDLGAKELGCYGNTKHLTPNLDGLAKGGVQFRTCWATPICSPTRVLIMTGRYGFRTGFWNLIGRPGSPRPDMPEYDIGVSQITFADVLKTRGYTTALAGKWQLSGKFPTFTQDCGFEEYCIWAYANYLPEGTTHQGAFEAKNKPSRYWHPCIIRNAEVLQTKPDDWGPDIYTDFVIDFIKRHKDGPFFVYYPMCLTHGPFYPTPDTLKPGEDKMRHSKDNFKANVEYMDKLVGRIVKALDEMGLRENTIVFFTGDNGTGGEGKGQATELGARVPMIVNCPGTVTGGVVSDELVDLSDVLPTVADFGGADLPKDREIDGHSFAPFLRGEPFKGREWIFSYIGDKRIIRDKRWLLEGDGKFFDCGDCRDGTSYKDVTASTEPEVLAAKERLEEILADKPAPTEEYMKLWPEGEKEKKKGKKNKKE
ncbi:MAG: sulfatase-like hydrolase/transferase [Planctomycetota bacterium]